MYFEFLQKNTFWNCKNPTKCGIAFWEHTAMDFLNQCLWVLQKRMIRYIFREKLAQHCCFIKHGILSVTSICTVKTVSIIEPTGLLNTTPYCTCQKENLLKLPTPRSDLVKRSLIYKMDVKCTRSNHITLKETLLTKFSEHFQKTL